MLALSIRQAVVFLLCHNLKALTADGEAGAECVFGRNGLAGLQAMAAGCQLLTVVSLHLTVSGIHCLGTSFTQLKKCAMLNKCEQGEPAPAGFPSLEELQTQYPAVEWEERYYSNFL